MSLITRHEAGEEEGLDVLNLLKNWLLNHIMKVDKGYVRHFRAHGVG